MTPITNFFDVLVCHNSVVWQIYHIVQMGSVFVTVVSVVVKQASDLGSMLVQWLVLLSRHQLTWVQFLGTARCYWVKVFAKYLFIYCSCIFRVTLSH